MTTPDFDPGPLALVESRREGDRITLVFVRDLNHPPEAIWRALTDPESLRAWAPFVPDRDLGAEGPAVLQMIDGMSDEALASTVHVAVAPETLEYTWAEGLVRWELSPRAGGTRLTLRHTVDDADWLPKLAAGWHLCLTVVDRRLRGEETPSMVGELAMDYGWPALHDAYQRLLEEGPGPEAGGR
ncbi:MAG: ATPase [Gammaproteobacteria bacterium]|jgi:uncharacterized protein YndB with AHSA1/START domain|nr:ATPase [Gammaproteobacteria bacterium]|tara:strand:- start:878 stop:1432 length:555 start_codon:yes stop_codon:yes gene_type:complete